MHDDNKRNVSIWNLNVIKNCQAALPWQISASVKAKAILKEEEKMSFKL